jgi:hypothetical protein
MRRGFGNLMFDVMNTDPRIIFPYGRAGEMPQFFTQHLTNTAQGIIGGREAFKKRGIIEREPKELLPYY